MENLTVKDVVLEKKMNDYKFEAANFQAAHEIMVTITLDEYRDLVSKAATRKADIDEAEKNKYEREQKIKQLEKENAELKSQLYDRHVNKENPFDDEDSREVPF